MAKEPCEDHDRHRRRLNRDHRITVYTMSTMGALAFGALFILGACDDTPTPSPPPKVEAAAAAWDPISSPLGDDTEPKTSTASAPPPVVATCEGSGLRAFACEHAKICAAVDPGDDSVTLPEFLCTARSARALSAPLRVGDVLGDLPVQFRRSFTLKHGTKERGLRGHPQEIMADVVGDALAKRSQSADLDFPRVIMWDDTTGFTISYNGGLSTADGATRSQTGADRLDLMGWDPSTATFEMWALDLPVRERELGPEGGWTIAPYQPTHEDDNCTHCHGPRSRPIWPMYPDWPGFYGSDNDELTGEARHQSTEREFLAYFRACVASGPSEASELDADAFDCTLTRLAAAKRVGAGALDPSGDLSTDPDLVDRQRRYDTLFAAVVQPPHRPQRLRGDRGGRDLPRVLRTLCAFVDGLWFWRRSEDPGGSAHGCAHGLGSAALSHAIAIGPSSTVFRPRSRWSASVSIAIRGGMHPAPR